MSRSLRNNADVDLRRQARPATVGLYPQLSQPRSPKALSPRSGQGSGCAALRNAEAHQDRRLSRHSGKSASALFPAPAVHRSALACPVTPQCQFESILWMSCRHSPIGGMHRKHTACLFVLSC